MGSTSWVGHNADGRLEVFVAGVNVTNGQDALWHMWQTAPSSTEWSDWSSLGTPAVNLANSPALGSSPTVAANADGRLEVFVAGGDGALWHVWQTAPNNGWSDWSSFGTPGGLTSASNPALAPAVAANADGRLEVFIAAGFPSGELWHVWQTAPSNGWSSWASFGPPGVKFLRSAAVAPSADGRLELFAVDTDLALWHVWQTAINNGWSDWASLGTPPQQGSTLVPQPVLASADGCLQLFASDDTGYGGVWNLSQTAPSNGWSAWSSLGNPAGGAGELAAATNTDGRVFLATVPGQGDLWYREQTALNNGWSDWTSLASPMGVTGFTGTPEVARNADDRLELFAVGADGVLWHTWQTAPDGDWWDEWVSLGNPAEVVPAGA